LNFDLLTPKSNQFISVPRCTSDKSLAEIRQQILEISRKQNYHVNHGRTHGRTDSGTDGRPENIWSPPAPTGGGGLKIIHEHKRCSLHFLVEASSRSNGEMSTLANGCLPLAMSSRTLHESPRC